MGRLIDIDDFIHSITPDPIEEAGCPEPEWLRDLVELVDEYIKCKEEEE